MTAKSLSRRRASSPAGPRGRAVRGGDGAAPRPAVPRTLRLALALQELPPWLCEAAGLADGATVKDVGPELLIASYAQSGRMQRWFCRQLAARQADLGDVYVLDRPWPAGLDARRVPWPGRIGGCLDASGLLDDPASLSQLTYGDLLALPKMGPKSVYSFAVAAESALDDAGCRFAARPELVELAAGAAAASWVDLVSGDDPRFADLLASGNGTLADLVAAAGSRQPGVAQDGWLELAAVLPAISERIARIEQSPLDLALRTYVAALAGLDGERLDAVLGRLGLDGRPPRSLPRAVNGAKISPERLRQIQARIVPPPPSRPVYLPALDRALELLARTAPAQAETAAALLQSSGISTVPFHPASVLAAAALCGRQAAFALERTPSGSCVVSRPMSAYAPQLGRLAARGVRSFGAVSLTELVARAAAGGLAVSADEARDALVHHVEAEFLGDDWFWLPAGGNRLVLLTNRILAVAAPLDVATIRAGVCRTYRRGQAGGVPPLDVMRRFYDTHPAFAVDPVGLVRPVDRLDPEAVLGGPDRIFLDVFSSSWTGVLDRPAFHEACVARGMTSQSFGFATAYSAVLDRPEPKVWCLRGTRISAVTLAALRHARALDGG